MSPKLPQIKPRQIAKVLVKFGFVPRKTKSSHVVYRHKDGRRTVVPMHARPVSIGTLRAILRQSDITLEQLLESL